MDDTDRVKTYVEAHEGQEAVRVAEALMSRTEATDSELAEELGQKPSHIRRVLYALYEERLAEYHKEKDKETGWLTFYWQLNATTAASTIMAKARRNLADLQRNLEFEESNEFFICPSGKERFDFGQATECSFSCPEHGTMLESHDNSGELADLRDRVAALQSETESAS